MSAKKGVLPAEAADADGGEFKGVLTVTRDRVAEILAATERAAAEIVEAANAESEQIVRETHARAENLAKSRMERIDSVTEAVLAKAGALEGEIDGLRDLVRESLEQLAEQLGIDAGAQPEPAEADQSTPPQGDKLMSNGMRSSAKRDRSEAVKLLATQMMAAGHSKEEARRRLTEEFGVKDPSVVLDSIGIRS